jgi:hypothetical protein
MDIVVICNGLGNQMSQYAFYLKKKEISKTTRFIFDRRSLYTHNGYELKRVFNIDYKETVINKILFLLFRFLLVKRIPILTKPIIYLFKLLGVEIVNEKFNYDFDESLLPPFRGIKFFFGGWHSEKYFFSIKDQIQNVFKFNIPENDVSTFKLLNEIRNKNSVSIHIRKGDFLSPTNIATFGVVCTKEYFDTAIKLITTNIDNPYFYIFSNDISWVQNNFKLENMTIVNQNLGLDSWKDMFLISQCNHNINSNSTFSWWGAWLNKNIDKKVIIPEFFINNLETKDFYPDNWLKLQNY